MEILIAANWQRSINSLKGEIPIQQFNTWIRPLRVEAGAANLKILAPNRFVKDWVQEKFLHRIKELFNELNESEVEIIFEVSPAKESRAEATEHTQKKRVLTADDTQEEQRAWAQQVHTPQFDSLRGGKLELGRAGSLTGPLSQRASVDQMPPTSSKDIIVAGKLRHKGTLNRDSTFENFIEGKSNQLARAAAVQVAENPGYAYNPLFIYGGVGLGKTHLMHAIGNYLVAKKPGAKVVYLHSETFVATMVNALQLNAINEFKRFYRSVDALLIDDIQFFAGKERSQEEFFHTFNALLEGGQQIILTCDRFHKEINGLEERLKSRFGWGLTVAVEPPELETRAAILIKKAAMANIDLSNEAAMFIAQRLRSNVRELEGALKRVIAHSNFVGEKIDPPLVKEALRDLFAVQDKQVTIDNIQRSVAEYYRIKMADMLSKRRNRSVARPRQVAMTLSKELTNHSLPEIGDAFGGRDHTTVLHACKQVSKLRHSSTDIQEDYDNLLRHLSS